MRRQTALASGPSAGSGRFFRLDPFALPIRYSAAPGGGDGPSAILLDGRQATFTRLSRSGVPTMVTVPVSAYRGVAARIAFAGESAVRVVIELVKTSA